MKPLAVVLVALVTLALGFVGGLLLGPSGSGGRRGPVDVSALPQAPTATKRRPEAETLAAPLEAPRERVLPTAPPRNEARLSEATYERALAGVGRPEVAPAPRGDGAIVGRTLDELGQPLAGVLVVATAMETRDASDPTYVGLAEPRDLELDELLRERAEEWARKRAGKRSALSAADGTYRLESLVPGQRYSLGAWMSGYSLKPLGNAHGVTAGQTVTFRGEPIHEIPLELVYADGTPVDEGVVTVKRGEDVESYAWTPAQPFLRLTEGLATVRAYAGVNALQWRDVDADSASEEVDLDPATQGGATLRMVLTTITGIRGRLVDPTGEGLSRTRVKLLPLAAGAEPDTKALADSSTDTYLEGERFLFKDLEPGTYVLGPVTWQKAVLAYEVVEVTRGFTEVELVLPEPDPERHLLVRALGPSGAPLQNLEFSLSRKSGRGSRSGGIGARRDPSGVWWLRPDESFFEPWGEGTAYELRIEHAQLGTRIAPVEEGQRELDVVFEEPVRLVVELLGYEASGLQGKLRVQPVLLRDGVVDDPGQRTLYRADSDAISSAGESVHDDLAPGTWEVRLLLGGGWDARTLATREVTLTRGEERVRMEVPALYDLSVVAPGLEPGTRINLFQSSAGGTRSFRGFSGQELGADHRARFTSLLAGDYRLQANGMPESMTVTVPCAEVVIDARPHDCLRVTIGDMQGDLYRAGFRAGDLILAVNGEELGRGVNSWELLRSGVDLRCSVLRDGDRVDVTLPKVDLQSNWTQSLGGMLLPGHRP